MRRLWVVSGVLLWTLAACGDDDSPGVSAGTGRGGDGGRAGDGSGGRAGESTGGASGANSGGQSGASPGGSGGRSGTSGRSGAGGVTSQGGAAGEETGGDYGSPPKPVGDPVTITFKAVLADQDFKCGTAVTGQGAFGTTVTPMDFRTFVQDVKLIDDQGVEFPVALDVRPPWQSADVALLDFEDGTGACASSGNTETNVTITGKVATGNRYTAISFVNGVPEALNHDDPATLTEPLASYAALHWDWLMGFRFVKLELAALADPGDPNTTVATSVVHIGSVGCANAPTDVDAGPDAPSIVCSKPNRNRVVLADYNVGKSVIVADVGRLFGSTNLGVDSTCHGSGPACEQPLSSLGIDPATGLPLSDQSLYSVQ